MHELAVISGKGGTGKTSVTASFAVLANRPVIADCDVDAADLHLLLQPEIQRRHAFHSGHQAVIRQEDCTGCGACFTHCRFGAIVQTNHTARPELFHVPAGLCDDCDFCQRSCAVKANEMAEVMRGFHGDSGKAIYSIDPISCEGCGVCVHVCSANAIGFPERVGGEWYLSETRHGPMVHARLGVAAENSGKLVSIVRREARRIAGNENRSTILVDGPPGIGCQVIAALTGTSLVLAVTEPTPSGRHDLQRILALTRHFGIPVAVCVNKWDLNPSLTEEIERGARALNATTAGRIRYDPGVTKAQLQNEPVVEYECAAAAGIRDLWDNLKNIGGGHGIEL